jgi:ATP-dependent RNA helicase RhlE
MQLNSFNSLGLAAPITRALAEENYTTPTPIQKEAIPHVLARRDLVGIAQTGTGKTAAFALPILNHLLTQPMRREPRFCRVLVLSPTRELSGQILESFRTYGRYVRPTLALAIGGVPMSRQVRALSGGVDVLVATPGRLLDLMRNRAVHLDHVEVFVLDEADRMLDMGFIHDIRTVVAKLPAQRQTLFFSATMPGEIESLVAKLLRDPIRVAVTPGAKTVDQVDQRILLVDQAAKGGLLADLLKREPIDRALVFTRTKRGADRVVRGLKTAGIAAQAIHGNKSQNQRERVLADFREGKVRILIATDIAARGIDVDGISHVINYDLPNIPESYVHRIGRTARAGNTGFAISFCDHEEMAYLRDIERLIRMPIASTDLRKEPHRAAPKAHRPHGNRPGQNGNHRQHGRGNKPHRGRHGSGQGSGQGRAEAPRHEHAEPRNGELRGTELSSVNFLQRKPARDQHGPRTNGNHRHAR